MEQEGLEVELKNCPFCGGEARMECTRKFKGSGGCRGLVIFVKHDQSCIINEQSLFLYGYINFDIEGEVGKHALNGVKHEFAEQWNRRA